MSGLCKRVCCGKACSRFDHLQVNIVCFNLFAISISWFNLDFGSNSQRKFSINLKQSNNAKFIDNIEYRARHDRNWLRNFCRSSANISMLRRVWKLRFSLCRRVGKRFWLWYSDESKVQVLFEDNIRVDFSWCGVVFLDWCVLFRCEAVYEQEEKSDGDRLNWCLRQKTFNLNTAFIYIYIIFKNIFYIFK